MPTANATAINATLNNVSVGESLLMFLLLSGLPH
jgi:hypothetical protein